MKSIVTQRFINCHHKLKEENRIRSSRQFAISLDYLPQSLSEILKGRRDVTIEVIRKAVETYKINPVYLYTGERPMFMTAEDHKSFRVLTIVTNARDDERIVHVPVSAQTGYAGEQVDPTFIQDLPTFTLPDYKYKAGTHRSFDVSGDSMEPTLFEGDKVVCNFLEPTLWESAIKDNYVYVIITRTDVMVKRVNNFLRTEKQLKIISDNAFYESIRIDLRDIREVWHVRAKISPFLPSPQNIRTNLLEEIKELKQTIIAQGKMLLDLNDSVEKIVDNGTGKE